jgi:uncharacterized membrane protein
MTVDDRGALPPPLEEEISPLTRFWRQFCSRLIQGLFLILPLLITCWVFYWLYSFIESYVVSPLSAMVVWKSRSYYGDGEVPRWFQAYGAPALGIILLILILIGITFLAYTRLHRATTWLLIHMPIFSWIYNPVRKVFVTLETHSGGEHGHKRPQRMVLVSFPHTGMKVPGIVTGSTRDRDTGKTILCVYVPTTPVPTSGYFLLVPEEETTELNWTTEEALQSIISGGLAAPPEVTYFAKRAAPGITPPPASGIPAN